MNTPEQSQLGKSSAYIDQYAPSLLFPLPRAPKREEIGIQGRQMPFFGADLWTAFELSWLNLRGKPQVALVHFTIPCETPNLIESKSFKLYLNSFNNTRLPDAAEVQARLRTDLADALWRGSEKKGSIGVKIIGLDRFDQEMVQELDGLLLDRLDVECTQYQPAQSCCTPTTRKRPSPRPSSATCSRATAWSQASPTGAACRSATAARRSTRKACCNTW